MDELRAIVVVVVVDDGVVDRVVVVFSWLREKSERENGRAARGTPLSPFVHLTRLLLIVCATRFSLFFLSRYVVPFAVR